MDQWCKSAGDVLILAGQLGCVNRPVEIVGGLRANGTQVGRLLLTTAGEMGADLLVMGGYGHSRLRELLLGRVTRHVLDHAPLPVLMAH